MNHAIHGDDVVVEIITKKGLQMEGRIVKIINRKLKHMVGELYYDKYGNPAIDLDDDKVKINIQIDKSKTLGAMPGHKVLVKVTNKLKDNNYRGEIIKILENKEVIIEQFLGVEDAKQVIQDAFDLYDKNKDHLAGR